MHMYDIFIDMLLPLYLFCNLDKKGCLTSFQYHNIPNLDWHVLFYVWIKNEDRLKKTEESYGNEVNILRPFISSDMT